MSTASTLTGIFGDIDASRIKYTRSMVGAVQRRVDAVLAENAASILDFGADPSGATDSSAAIQSAVNASAIVQIPAGTYRVLNTITLNDNQTVLLDDGAHLIWGGSVGVLHPFFWALSKSNICIRGGVFTATDNLTRVLAVANCADVTLENTEVRGGTLFNARVNGLSYTSVVIDRDDPSFNGNKDIVVRNNKVVGSSVVDRVAAISLTYTVDFLVTGNLIADCGHGIQLWGGDSNPSADGAISNERKCKRGIVVGNCVRNGRGGIWGSMAQHVEFSANSVTDVDDVGLDFEGCFDSAAVGNVVSNSFEANLSTFYFCRNIFFGSNTSSQSSTQHHYRCFNAAGTTDNKSILFVGNSFMTIGTISQVSDSDGCCERLTFSGNTLVNTRIQFDAPHAKYVVIRDNELFFDTAFASPFCAIQSRVMDSGICEIINNSITTNQTYSADSAAVYAYGTDAAASNTFLLRQNTCAGFAVDMRVGHSGAAAAKLSNFFVFDNCLHGGHFERLETGAAPSFTLLRANMSSSGNFPNAVPVSGTWTAGTRIEFNAPTAEHYTGAICTESGTPGTWLRYGLTE